MGPNVVSRRGVGPRNGHDACVSDDAAWEPIPDYGRNWTPFDAVCSFTPRFANEPDGITRPGIAESPGSITFSLAPITRTGSEAQFCAGVQALNAEVLRAFVRGFPRANDWWCSIGRAPATGSNRTCKPTDAAPCSTWRQPDGS